MKSQRSAAYPYYSISYCMDFCTKIYKNFGSYRSSRESISKSLSISVGSLNQKIGSSVQYGFLDVKPKEGYKVTDLFLSIYRPLNDKDESQSKEQAFKNPTLYGNLLADFENEILPQKIALSNILFQKHSISERACERAANIFIENANSLNFVTDEGMLILRDNSAISDMEFVEPEEIETVIEEDGDKNKEDTFSKIEYIKNSFDDSPNQKASLVVKDGQTNYETSDRQQNNLFENVNHNDIVINVLLKNRRTAQIILPKDTKSSDLDTITNWINMMRQSFD